MSGIFPTRTWHDTMLPTSPAISRPRSMPLSVTRCFWCDISEGLPFAGNAAKRIIAEVLEMAPLSRVCYGSDTYGSPEPFYTSALLGKQALVQVMDELIADGFLSEGEAQTAAKMILADNARELYSI